MLLYTYLGSISNDVQPSLYICRLKAALLTFFPAKGFPYVLPSVKSQGYAYAYQRYAQPFGHVGDDSQGTSIVD